MAWFFVEVQTEETENVPQKKRKKTGIKNPKNTEKTQGYSKFQISKSCKKIVVLSVSFGLQPP